MDIGNQEALLRIGEVWSVDGRTVRIKVDENKNVSHLLYKGTIIKNVSVGSFVKISKGFIRIIAKVEGERVTVDKDIDEDYHSSQDVFNRYLDVKLLGFIDNNRYFQGIKEMPLVGNCCSLVEKAEFELVHRFASDNENAVCIGSLLLDDEQQIFLDINQLFGSHIGIFGNTGSGKSYTLTNLYHHLFLKASNLDGFKDRAKFLIFDFNGEYSGASTITGAKKVYKLNTNKQTDSTDRIPISSNEIAKPEFMSILANATEKTQQPFIKRALRLRETVFSNDKPLDIFKDKLRRAIIDTLLLADGVKGNLLLNYLYQILDNQEYIDTNSLYIGIGFHSFQHCFQLVVDGDRKWMNDPGAENFIYKTLLYQSVDYYVPRKDFISQFIDLLYLQLIIDVIANRAVNEHIAPAINKLKATQKSFDKVFEITEEGENCLFGDSNLAVIDMNECNTEMKKLIPLLLSQEVYNNHKKKKVADTPDDSLHIIIDEAHNILSYESTRESETWKDYRLEVFEEIIKEGRKFGVFLTIASQRPSDISHTIISQLHNYFIHRLVNQKDIDMVANNVSYLDKLSVEQLPILPQGGCIVAGVMTQLPVIIQVSQLSSEIAPQSRTIQLLTSWNTPNDIVDWF